MSSDYDATEFIDGDFQAHHSSQSATSGRPGQLQRAPSREEVDSKVAEAQQKLSELKRAQEQLERERAALEETRRRQIEFQTGRREMTQHLTRGLGLLQEAEFNARRDAEDMSKAITGLQDALAKLECIHEESWGRDNFEVELTRALTSLENARMEWNGARLKFALLANPAPESAQSAAQAKENAGLSLSTCGFGQLCKLGFALTWPLAAVALLALAAALALLVRR
jgi:chromosome segregation ATPase